MRIGQRLYRVKVFQHINMKMTAWSKISSQFDLKVIKQVEIIPYFINTGSRNIRGIEEAADKANSG